MVVLSAYQQMRNQKQPVLSEVGEDNFDRAFRFLKPGKQATYPTLQCSLFRNLVCTFVSSEDRNSNSYSTLAVIQGHADATKTFSQDELDKTIGFLTTALQPVFNPGPEEEIDQADPNAVRQTSELGTEDVGAMKALTSHHIEDTSGVGRFTADVIDGRLPKLERGNLTLVAAASS